MVKKALMAVFVIGFAAAGAQMSGAAAAQTTASSTKTIELPPDNAMASLKPGPGVEMVQRHCASCHSTDYIVRQPGGDAKHWEPEVKKMIAVYGAQISDADVQTIANYLGKEYITPPAAAKPARAKSPQPPANRARSGTPSRSELN